MILSSKFVFRFLFSVALLTQSQCSLTKHTVHQFKTVTTGKAMPMWVLQLPQAQQTAFGVGCAERTRPPTTGESSATQVAIANANQQLAVDIHAETIQIVESGSPLTVSSKSVESSGNTTATKGPLQCIEVEAADAVCCVVQRKAAACHQPFPGVRYNATKTGFPSWVTNDVQIAGWATAVGFSGVQSNVGVSIQKADDASLVELARFVAVTIDSIVEQSHTNSTPYMYSLSRIRTRQRLVGARIVARAIHPVTGSVASLVAMPVACLKRR